MDSNDVTREQIEALQVKVRPMLGYLSRLGNRIVQHGYPHDDKLRHLVWEGRNAMQALSVELHYMTCSGVGRKPRG